MKGLIIFWTAMALVLVLSNGANTGNSNQPLVRTGSRESLARQGSSVREPSSQGSSVREPLSRQGSSVREPLVRQGSLVRHASYNRETKPVCGDEPSIQGSGFDCDAQFCTAIKNNFQMHKYCPEKKLNVDPTNIRCIQVECSLVPCLQGSRKRGVCLCAFVFNDNEKQQSRLIPYLVYEKRDTFHIFNYAKLSEKPYVKYDGNSSMIIQPEKYSRRPLTYIPLGNVLLYRELTGFIDESNCHMGSLHFNILPPIP